MPSSSDTTYLRCASQPRFRSMWERYCRGVQAIVFVVDSADMDALEQARKELHALLTKPSLVGIPLLVLGNKDDLPQSLTTNELIDRLELKVCSIASGCSRKATSLVHECGCVTLKRQRSQGLRDREVAVYSISCKSQNNIDITIAWLTQHGK